jgi:ATP-dependent RNA helicase SUPV3L1/SUV3
MDPALERRVIAVLGPTNTGKTHFAIDRMLGHRSGMIGFPLRLLARENYDKIRRLKGAASVALITGEERILPPNPSWFVCTVEAMPLDRHVAFLAVDEIQLAADPERGHVFTQRLLAARGEEETLLLGAETIRPLLRRLVPDAEILTRPRFSTLSYAGSKKVTRLPPRSAVVAFSVAEVYRLAELVRRQRGGTAVVMGALSPRTRNAQIALYQGGEVDYLVATDAIGMGLNMDVDHVAFAGLSKFDGRVARRLSPAEMAQIAGRAGRHMNDGTFGTTAELGPLDPELVEAIETHSFDPLTALYWRNDALDFASPERLLKSLDQRPPSPVLVRAREAEDQQALAALSRDPELARLAAGPAGVRLLWEVCQIPDFRKILSDAHVRLLGQIFRHLATSGRLPPDWVAGQIARIDRVDGDIDTLVGRIAHIRTWTYVSHRAGWLTDPGHWQERTRAIEDKLSDALHERLTQRFVDRRHAVLVRKLKDGGALLGAVTRAGDVVVEGHRVGQLAGFSFRPDGDAAGEEARPLLAAARRALSAELPARLARFESQPDEAFALGRDGSIEWDGVPVARLVAGDTPLAPRPEPLATDLIDGAGRERLRKRLALWLARHLEAKLAPLFRLREAPLAGAARGIAFQLVEALGLLPRAALAAQLATLAAGDRRALGRLGVRLGTQSVWLPALAGGEAPALLAQLWALRRGIATPPLPRRRRPSLPADPALPAGFWQAIGYRLLGGRALRADALEHLAALARKAAAAGPFAADAALCAAAGCDPAGLALLLPALGYRRQGGDPGDGPPRFVARPRGPRRRGRGVEDVGAAQSPFAKLRGLRLG